MLYTAADAYMRDFTLCAPEDCTASIDPPHDKGLLKKIYEKTKADLSGPVENPKANTWEMVVTLIQNGFFEAVLPRIEGRPNKGS